MCQNAAYIIEKYPDVIMHSLEPNTGRVLVAQTAHFFPVLYNDASLNYPVEIKHRLQAVGNTSAMWRTSIHHKASQAPLCKEDVVLVNVDLASREPIPFDKGFAEKCRKYCQNDTIPKISSPPKPSGELYTIILYIIISPLFSVYYERTGLHFQDLIPLRDRRIIPAAANLVDRGRGGVIICLSQGGLHS